MQWCIFAAIYVDKQALPTEIRDADRLQSAQEDLIPHLNVLEGHLSDYGNLKRWLARCLERPARVGMNG